jgi:hypothetical protein
MHKKFIAITAAFCALGNCFAEVACSFEKLASVHADGTRSSKVTIGKVKSFLPDGSSAVRSAAQTSDGKYVFFVHGFGRYRMPATQLDRGWICSSALSVFDARSGKRINTVMLDEALKGAANPWGIAVNEKYIAITHAGTHEVSIIDRALFFKKLLAAQGDLSADFSFLTGIRKRIPLKGKGPREIKFREDGRLDVTLYFAQATAIVDPATGVVEEPDLPLGVSKAVAADPVRLGEMYFNDATLCYQSWLSCASCHVDGGNDGLTWDFPGDKGILGDPLETADLRKIILKPDCVSNSFKGDHLFVAPSDIVKATEAYLRSIGLKKENK